MNTPDQDKFSSDILNLGQSSPHDVVEIPIEEICLNPLQPRKKIVKSKIDQLADSIREQGLLQPVIVTRKDGLYHLVVGERRLRAAKKLGMKKLPAIIKECAWEQMLKIALVENLQREDLNPVEEARAYRMLIQEYNFTQEQVSRAIGRSRSYVANMVRLLNLPISVVNDLEAGDLSPGHARAILSLEDDKQILKAARKVKKEDLSVRQTEGLIRRMKEGGSRGNQRKNKLTSEYQWIQDKLQERFSTEVSIKKNKNNRGKIEITFSSEEHLINLLNLLGVQEDWTDFT